MKKRLEKWIERLETAGSLPTDTAEERLRKAVLTFLASIYCIAGIIWGISYLALGLHLSGIIPLAYSFISGLSLIYFFQTKRYGVFRFSQLSLILLLPFALQCSLGGFAASSTVMIWSILSPVGALMFAGTTRAMPWFLAYLVLMVITGLLDPKLAQDPAAIPLAFKVIFFIMNLGGVSTIFYVLLRYFVHERELAMAVLDKEHRRVVEEKDRLDKIKRVMANFVPETAKSIIEKDPEKGPLDKYVQDATVLFLDIEGFTSLLHKYSTERINHVIESYFSIFYDLIQKNGGDVNEMAGDGMMVIFLEPDPITRARSAVRAALEIQEQCIKYSEERDSFLFPIQVNIGICSGEVYLGSTKMRGTGGGSVDLHRFRSGHHRGSTTFRLCTRWADFDWRGDGAPPGRDFPYGLPGGGPSEEFQGSGGGLPGLPRPDLIHTEKRGKEVGEGKDVRIPAYLAHRRRGPRQCAHVLCGPRRNQGGGRGCP